MLVLYGDFCPVSLPKPYVVNISLHQARLHALSQIPKPTGRHMVPTKRGTETKKNTTSIAPLLQNITRNNGSISVIQYPTNKGQSFDNLSFLKIKPNFPAPPYGYLGKIHSEHKLHQQLLRDTATNWWSPRKAIEKTVAEKELDRYRLSPRVWQ